MTNRPTLPPQAYTREMLSTAFQWLQSQPESIKKLAHTPDALVGLYLRAQKFGNASPEADAPVSSQAFVNDLKNLAEGLKQFEEPKAKAPSTNNFATRIRTEALTMAAAATAATTAAFAGASASPYVGTPQATIEIPTTQSGTSQTVQTVSPSLVDALNPAAQSMIQEVKQRLNLTSDAEVMNMMVALAYKNLKNLLA